VSKIGKEYVILPAELFGISNVKHLEEITEAGLELPTVNQVEVWLLVVLALVYYDSRPILNQLHPYCQQKSIVDYCRAHDIIVQAYTPLVRGEFEKPVLQELSKKVC
jgi:diketogulonate reductase-like aldo/keto reductase